MNLRVGSLTMLTLLHLVACSRSHTGAGSKHDAQVAFCKYVARCRPDEFAQSYGSLKRCVELGACRGPAVMPPGVEECVEELATASCGVRDSILFPLTRHVCDVLAEHAFAREGESCVERPCAEGLRCDVVPDDAPPTYGRCLVCVRPLQPGDPCDMTSADGYSVQCSGGYCDETGHCRAPKLEGEPCENSWQCAGHWCAEGACGGDKRQGEPCAEDHECFPELVCRFGKCYPSWFGDCASECGPDQTCQAGRCVDLTCEPAQEGEGCDVGCAEGLFCGFSTARCEPRSARGGSCNPNVAGLGALSPGRWAPQCPDHQYCARETERCTDKPLAGEPCGQAAGQCEDGLFCEMSSEQPVCVETRPDGARCTWGGECTSSVCFEGLCGVGACLPG